MDIYVGNLANDASEGELKELFSSRGQVATVKIIKDRETGESRGFGFVEMPVVAEASAAINALNGSDFKGNKLNIREARPKTFKQEGGGYNGNSYGGNSYGGNSGGYNGNSSGYGQNRDRAPRGGQGYSNPRGDNEGRKKFFGNDRPKKRFDRGNSFGE